MSEQTPPVDPTSDPEPEGVVEHAGQKMVPLAALTAERTRVREATAKQKDAEYETIKQKAAKADQLEADLSQLQPYIQRLQQNPKLMEPEKALDVPGVSDEDAEKFARDYELYTQTGLNIPKAKQIIARQRAELEAVAKSAAAEAVKPAMAMSATQQSRQNFAWAASQKGADGAPLVDTPTLAQVWASMPAEVTANPEAAKTVLQWVAGQQLITGKRPQRAEAEPVFSETPGGRPQPQYKISGMEKAVAKIAGLSEAEFSKQAQKYQPDAVNVLGD